MDEPNMLEIPKPESTLNTCLEIVRGRPTRYIWGPRPVKGRKSRMTKRNYWIPVKAGEPGYGEAPYEMSAAFKGLFTSPFSVKKRK